jgi:hypothetical protein
MTVPVAPLTLEYVNHGDPQTGNLTARCGRSRTPSQAAFNADEMNGVRYEQRT